METLTWPMSPPTGVKMGMWAEPPVKIPQQMWAAKRSANLEFPDLVTNGSSIVRTVLASSTKKTQLSPLDKFVCTLYIQLCHMLTFLATIVSTMWRRESREVKDYFKNLAEEEDRQHKAKYPQYKYQARKSGTNKRKHQQVSA